MGKPTREDKPDEKPKNIKNVYLTKINSLMQLSHDSLMATNLDILSQPKDKKIKKTQSVLDNTTLKLEKNRQAARKARQRKNLYIKLLENQVEDFFKTLNRASKIQEESNKLLKRLKQKKKEVPIKLIKDQLDRYISREDLADPEKQGQEMQSKICNLQHTVTELKQNFFPTILPSVTELQYNKAKELELRILKDMPKNSNDQVSVREKYKQDIRNIMASVKGHKAISDEKFIQLFSLTARARDLMEGVTFDPSGMIHEGYLRQRIQSLIEGLNLANIRTPQEEMLSQIDFGDPNKSNTSIGLNDILKGLSDFEGFIDQTKHLQQVN